MKLASFDIFDTTLIRKCGDPQIVFNIMALKLWPNDNNAQQQFVTARIQTESKLGNPNCTIEDIYNQSTFNQFKGVSAKTLLTEELEIESYLLCANIRVRNKINKLRKEGWTIKFISDMYLPSSFLTEILKREGCFIDGDEVIVSCEWKARKDNGMLFRKVKTCYKPSRWIHCGDNHHSDVKMAAKQKIKATHIDTNFSEVEKHIISKSNYYESPWILKLLAGLSRWARLVNDSSAECIVASDYVAPLCISYTMWLLRDARKRGIERLNFLSRDGYIFMKIAEIVNLEDIQLKYLFVSRRALMKAFVVEDPRNRLVAIQENNSLIWCSVNSILKNLGIDRQEAYDKFGIKFPDGTITTIEQSNSLIETLFGESEFSKDLINRLKESETLTIEYLKQEGLSDNTISQGMVDLGWMGSSRYMINQLLGTSIPTYYLGVNYAVFPPNYGEYMSFFESNQIDLGATALLENYYVACIYGTTIGYSKELSEQNYVKPVLGRQNKLMSKNISTTNVEICQQITECLLCIFKKIGIDIVNREDIISKNHLIAWSLLSIEKMLQFNRAEEIEPLKTVLSLRV